MDANDFLITSDYETIKIVKFMSGSFTTSYDQHDIPHGLPFRPIGIAQYSLDGNIWSSSTAIRSLPTSLSVIFTDTFCRLVGINEDPLTMELTPVTMYWRIFLIQPPGSNDTTDYSYAGGGLDPMILDSDKNYLKVKSFAPVTVTSSGQSILHGLGYTPIVMVWGHNDFSNYILPHGYVNMSGAHHETPERVEVNDTHIIFTNWFPPGTPPAVYDYYVLVAADRAA